VSPALREYVASLDVEADIERLKHLLGDALPTPCLLTLRIGTELLQSGLAKKLTLCEIGRLMVREDFDRPSKLELAIDETYQVLVSNGLKGRLVTGGQDQDHRRFMEAFKPIIGRALDLVKEKRMLRSVSG
jgi:hypothetical protein